MNRFLNFSKCIRFLIILFFLFGTLVPRGIVGKRQIWKPLRRLHYTLGAAAITALTLSFWVWNLIGWQF